eukprot:CAMPEP_0115045134 /NCGR_PEP_ID=MMETSP0216-20121206/47947_1 /TAXON_ID=223996 /ORGANISM="Protocruzia adherens, Strain Boccale" /LENGTH=703 /DNA_ID=CAMNT_0002427915 /DNA_START=61 /DNA_END=2169 /DNA_ORIENTATION=-
MTTNALKYWKTNHSHSEAEIQLKFEEPSIINRVELVNHGAVDIQIRGYYAEGFSSLSFRTNYNSYLLVPSTTLISLPELVENDNRGVKRKRIFDITDISGYQLGKPLAAVKITCSNPHDKDFPRELGLQTCIFSKFRDPSSASEKKIPESSPYLTSPSVTSSTTRLSPHSVASTKSGLGSTTGDSSKKTATTPNMFRERMERDSRFQVDRKDALTKPAKDPKLAYLASRNPLIDSKPSPLSFNQAMNHKDGNGPSKRRHEELLKNSNPSGCSWNPPQRDPKRLKRDELGSGLTGSTSHTAPHSYLVDEDSQNSDVTAAIQMSLQSARVDESRRQNSDEDEIELALRLSKLEYEREQKEREALEKEFQSNNHTKTPQTNSSRPNQTNKKNHKQEQVNSKTVFIPDDPIPTTTSSSIPTTTSPTTTPNNSKPSTTAINDNGIATDKLNSAEEITSSLDSITLNKPHTPSPDSGQNLGKTLEKLGKTGTNPAVALITEGLKARKAVKPKGANPFLSSFLTALDEIDSFCIMRTLSKGREKEFLAQERSRTIPDNFTEEDFGDAYWELEKMRQPIDNNNDHDRETDTTPELSPQRDFLEPSTYASSSHYGGSSYYYEPEIGRTVANSYSSLLEDVVFVICCPKLRKSKISHLHDVALAMGACFLDTWSDVCTHLLLEVDGDEETTVKEIFVRAKEKNCSIVKPQWLV